MTSSSESETERLPRDQVTVSAYTLGTAIHQKGKRRRALVAAVAVASTAPLVVVLGLDPTWSCILWGGLTLSTFVILILITEATAGSREGRAFRLLVWYRREVATSADRCLDLGDVDGARIAHEAMTSATPWDRFQRDRVAARMGAIPTDSLAAWITRLGASTSDGRRADGSLAVVEAGQLYRSNGAWLERLVRGPAMEPDDVSRLSLHPFSRTRNVSLVGIAAAVILASGVLAWPPH